MKYFRMMMVFAMVLTGTQSFAQKKDWNPEERAQKQTERMTEALALSEDQASRVMEINLEAARKMQEVRKTEDQSKEAKMESRKQLRTEKETELKEVLTAEQWTKWEQLKKDRKGKRSGAKRGMNRNRKLDPEQASQKYIQRLSEALELTEEQAASIKKIHLAGLEEMKAAKDSMANTQPENRREIMKQHFAKQEAAVKEVLSPEQTEKWEELKKEHFSNRRDHRKGKNHKRRLNKTEQSEG